MKKRNLTYVLIPLSLLLPSCNNTVRGRINFELEGGSFVSDSFSTTYLEGDAGTPVTIDIPDVRKDGYYFVGWREKTKDGGYREINKKLSDDGKSYYYYPYGTDTFYAYFEPLVTIHFDLTDATEGTLLAPEMDTSSFDQEEMTMSGYASKEISSTRYLPTADGTREHLNFDYWYTKYPIVKSTDENKTTHYSINENGEAGEYRFDQSFTDTSMQYLLNTSFTLYAHWTSDPLITIHLNMEGKGETYRFQKKVTATDHTIEKELTDLMKNEFAIDYTKTGEDGYYYVNDGLTYRFSGFFQDAGLTKPFTLQSTIAGQDLDLYLKWDNQVKVTLDYDGGTVNDKTEEDFTYYSGDILGDDFLDSHIPTKQHATFSHYTLEGETFRFTQDALPKHDITLLAVYEEDPTLTLSYSYPDSFPEERRLSDKAYQIEKYKDISAILTAFRNNITDKDLITRDFFLYNSDNKQVDFTDTEMPEKSLTVYLNLDYKTQVTIDSYLGSDSTYTLSSEVASFEDYFYGAVSSFDTTFNGLKSNLMVSTTTYLYDGLYYDTSLTQEVLFPIPFSSNDTLVTLALHRKMSKAILLTFVEEDGTIIGTLYVLPGKEIDDYQNEIDTLLGTYQELKLGEEVLGTLLPSTDSTITVVWK